MISFLCDYASIGENQNSRRGSGNLKWGGGGGVKFCNNVIEPKPG